MSSLEVPASSCSSRLADFFDHLPWEGDPWEEAELFECVVYMRCAKRVQIPEEFKNLIPKVDTGDP